MKKINKGILFIICTLGILFLPQNYYAQTSEERDDPEYWRAQGYISDGFYDGLGEYEYGINQTGIKDGENIRFGIDVSKYQGNINWAQAKAQGVEFAIIRVGYRGSSSGGLNEDEYYKKNIEGALRQGIPVGVYIFSQAITESEAIEEANYVLARVSGYSISLPIVIDYEYAGQNGAGGRLYDANLSRSEATAICKAFCKTVQSAGYRGMVYANKSMLSNNLNAEEIAKDYYIWLAHYAAATNYTGAYDFWQYTSTGDGAAYGMQSQYVDLDYWYDDGSLYNAVYENIDYSAVFEPLYYADKYPDLKAAYGYDNEKLLSHFVKWGMMEGRQAKAVFNVHSYRNLYQDLRDVYGSDLKAYYMHYIKYGESEGRIAIGYENAGTDSETGDAPVYLTIYEGVDYSAIYDYSYYVDNNPDVYAAFGGDEEEVLRHFIEWGMMEGRQAKATFNVHSYRNLYQDLQEAYGSDLKAYYMHYVKYGESEGRTATGHENAGNGLDGDSDLDLENVVIYDGVNYSAVYNYSYYIENNPDVYAVFGNDKNAVLKHFIEWGMMEGRLACADFNVHIYRQRYEDLRDAYGNDINAYYLHYVNYGKAEGRLAI